MTTRRESGWFLAGQVALLFAALLWMPFGARDAAGVSTILPALRPTLPDPPAAHDRASHREQTPTPGRSAATRSAVAAIALVLVARRRVTATLRPTSSTASPRPPLPGRHGCRAPPQPC